MTEQNGSPAGADHRSALDIAAEDRSLKHRSERPGLLLASGGPVLALVVVLLANVFPRHGLKLPNPPALLFTIVAFSAFIGRVRSGLISAAIAWAYLAYSYWDDGKEDGTLRIAIAAVGLLFMVLVASVSKRTLSRERERLADLYRLLEERERAEAVLKLAASEAEAASRAKSEWVANVSHEVRTPLNAIIGMTSLAMRTDLTREQRDYLEMVKTSADALLAVINDLLDFSKIEAQKLVFEEVELDLWEALRDSFQTVALKAHEKGLELVYSLAPDVPRIVIGDPLRVRQVLINLLSNAVKFTEVGEVTAHVRLAEQAEGDEQYVAFIVKDTGIGIPKEKQAAIFQAFSQVDGSTTRQHGGTGLGLTISSRLAEAMGGGIRLESDSGRGSTFVFTARFHRAPSVAQPQYPDALAGLRVLLVDDHPVTRDVLSDVLAAAGLDVETAADLEGAKTWLARQRKANRPFDLFLVDAELGEADGFTFVNDGDPALAARTVMLLTSAAHLEHAAKCRAAKVAGYVVKPVPPDILLSAVCHALGIEVRTEETSPRLSIAYPDGPEGVSERRPRILVAEDNVFNQTLLLRLLEKKQYQTVVVDNGAQAFEAVLADRFDLVILDVQMPVMDGIAAARKIREKEASGTRVPMMALTAHALPGDRERFIDAGFDTYVSKPINATELYATIHALLSGARAPGSQDLFQSGRFAPLSLTPKPSTPPPPSITQPSAASPIDAAAAASLAAPASARPAVRDFDPAVALEQAGSDQELLVEVLGIFIEESAVWIDDILSSASQKNVERLRRAAHTVKGAASNCGAAPTSLVAADVERLAAAGDLAAATARAADLAASLRQLTSSVAAYLRAEQEGRAAPARATA